MIITLLQSIYDPNRTLPTEVEFYEQVIEDIEHFAVSSQVYWLLKEQDRLSQTPAFFRERLKRKYEEALYQSMFIKNQLEQILNKMEEMKIEVIPMKGVTFAEKYFGYFGARWTSDIDLLIKPAQVEQAIACVKELSFTTEDSRDMFSYDYGFSKILPGSPFSVPVELHVDILRRDTSKLEIADFWKDAAPYQSYSYVKEFSDLHTFYMICLHGWKHSFTSMKYFIDIMQLMYTMHESLNYKELFQMAAAHKTVKRMKNTLSTVYTQFPQLEEILPYPFRKTHTKWWSYQAIRRAEMKEMTPWHYMVMLYSVSIDFDQASHGFTTLQRMILPSKESISFSLGHPCTRGELLAEYAKIYRRRLHKLSRACFSVLK
ncbi:nucleotidyltransferase family protein [Ectobacillus polymachus]|uniref:nucleotidyltransferase family protein n=1 Tax=Ectobacillus polymachus TaxID=1508806 RepID=UPI003A83786A